MCIYYNIDIFVFHFSMIWWPVIFWNVYFESAYVHSKTTWKTFCSIYVHGYIYFCFVCSLALPGRMYNSLAWYPGLNMKEKNTTLYYLLINKWFQIWSNFAVYNYSVFPCFLTLGIKLKSVYYYPERKTPHIHDIGSNLKTASIASLEPMRGPSYWRYMVRFITLDSCFYSNDVSSPNTSWFQI